MFGCTVLDPKLGSILWERIVFVSRPDRIYCDIDKDIMSQPVM